MVVLVIVATLATTQALSCLPCNKETCPPVPKCKGGLTTDVCDCCTVCAKVRGERCGGPFNIIGKCDRGLTCCKRRRTDPNAVGRCRR